jgi:hypothetical protein
LELRDHFKVPAEAAVDGKSAFFTYGISTTGYEGSYTMCWGYSPIELSMFNIELGPFDFSVPPRGCYVQHGIQIKCDHPLGNLNCHAVGTCSTEYTLNVI